MSDEKLRDLERKAHRSGAAQDIFAVRVERKRIGLSAGLDLCLPHVWGLVGAGKGENLRFGQAVAALRAQCVSDASGLHPFEAGVVRPLTFKENIQARLAQYAATGRAGSLWSSWLDSCSAIVYKGGSTKFKIVRLSSHLLELPSSFRESLLGVNYGDFAGPQLDLQNDIYNQPLTQEQVVKHEGWLAVFEGDKDLLKEYAALVFGLLNRNTAMQFWVVQNSAQDQLRPLAVYNLGIDSDCGGFRDLDGGGRFARVCPP